MENQKLGVYEVFDKSKFYHFQNFVHALFLILHFQFDDSINLCLFFTKINLHTKAKRWR